LLVAAKDRSNVPGFGIITGVLILAVLYFGREVFIPLALAGLLAFLLAPMATRMERAGVPRTPSALLVIAVTFSLLMVTGWVVLGQIYNLALELPRYQENVSEKVGELHLNSAGRLAGTMQMIANVNKELATGSIAKTAPVAPILPIQNSRSRQAGRTPAPAPAQSLTADAAQKQTQPVSVRIAETEEPMFTVAMRNIRPLVPPLITAFVVFVFVVFMLLARDNLRDRAIRLAGDAHMHVTTVAMTDASSRVSRYLLMQFVVNVSFGVIAGLALWGIGVPHPVLWAVMAGMLRFIPYIGIWLAAAGPMLLALAASPGWGHFIWTALLYLVLELIAGNILEPLLYGSSTGISSLAILVAAIFWTWLWGPAGLLLSTPLTVCLVVIGRHFPQLQFLGILLGEDMVLGVPQRFYQRILATDRRDAEILLMEQLKTKSRADVYDTVVIPALSLVEEGRHSEDLTSTRSEQILQIMEEILEDLWLRVALEAASLSPPASPQKVFCVPARDYADEISAQMVMHAAMGVGDVRFVSSDVNNADLMEMIEAEKPNVVCVVGTPPHALRPLRLRCHQLRARFPDLTLMACILTADCDLSNMRGRVPMEDAQHVACSVQQVRDYLMALSNPVMPPQENGAEGTPVEEATMLPPLDIYALSNNSDEELFQQITNHLARSFDAPIAMINVASSEMRSWKAQIGLSEEAANCIARDNSICTRIAMEGAPLVVPDTAGDPRFAEDAFLCEKSIRFYAGAPLVQHDGAEIGSICVLDTRPRQLTEQQREYLRTVAEMVMNAIELRSTGARAAEEKGTALDVIHASEG
jgi:predicted PurR-regulated permease PerM